jgi:hypothetical protein
MDDISPEEISTTLTIKAGITGFTSREGFGRNKANVRMNKCKKTEKTSIWLKSMD